MYYQAEFTMASFLLKDFINNVGMVHSRKGD